jgi:oxygen-independent coproporphyrinogen-3 oxidase
MVWARLHPEIGAAEDRSLLLYVHIPYCTTKCVFCDWVREIPASRLRAGGSARGQYMEALARQIRHHGPRIVESGYTPRLIYWGGGTPTRLDAEEMAVLAGALREAFDLGAVEEFTVECSPETVTPEKLRTLAAAGVTRLSIGAQSFDDEELRRAGRAHSAAGVREAVACAHTAGFEDVNIDLIAAFPGQTLESLTAAVRQTLALEPSHVTVYVYRATEGTVMAEQVRKGYREANDYQLMLESYLAARELLQANDYHEYAIGYFARNTARPCRADQYYFSIEGDYFGFGSGAHSIFGHHYLENGGGQQDVFVQDPLAFSCCERFSGSNLQRLFTSVTQTLWVPRGLNFERFQRLYGLPFDAVAAHPQVRSFMGYYEMCGARFERTETHLRVTPDTMVPAYIRALSLYGTQNEGRRRSRETALQLIRT